MMERHSYSENPHGTYRTWKKEIKRKAAVHPSGQVRSMRYRAKDILEKVKGILPRREISLEEKKWIVEKLSPEASLTWTSADTQKLIEITGLKDIESISFESLPESDFGGIHVVLKKDNKISLDQLAGKFLGKTPETIVSRLFARYAFVIVDNLNFSYKSKDRRISPQYSQAKEQGLHQDAFSFIPLVRMLYQPPLDEEHTMLRQAPTKLCDARVYYQAVRSFFENLTEQEIFPDNLTEDERHLLDAVRALKEGKENSFVSFIQEEHQREFNHNLALVLGEEDDNNAVKMVAMAERSQGFNNLHGPHFYGPFLEVFYKTHQVKTVNYKEKRALIFNNFTSLHGRGVSPILIKKGEFIKEEQPIIPFDGIKVFSRQR